MSQVKINDNEYVVVTNENGTAVYFGIEYNEPHKYADWKYNEKTNKHEMTYNGVRYFKERDQ